MHGHDPIEPVAEQEGFDLMAQVSARN